MADMGANDARVIQRLSPLKNSLSASGSVPMPGMARMALPVTSSNISSKSPFHPAFFIASANMELVIALPQVL